MSPRSTILILGIDQKEDSSEKRQNSQQADFFALVVMDKKEESYRILYLNRDTITDIPQTDAFGKIYGYTENHLSLAHTYGDDDKMRCRNTVNAAEHLLYGIDIDAVPLIPYSLRFAACSAMALSKRSIFFMVVFLRLFCCECILPSLARYIQSIRRYKLHKLRGKLCA